jgi:signal peptidase I
MKTNKPKKGDIVEYDGGQWEVMDVWAKLTPGNPNPKPRQPTKVEILGWGMCLKRV